jgi:hypothetical protein
MKSKLIKIVIMLTSLISYQSNAYADLESWNFLETRVKLNNDIYPKTGLRVLSRTFINQRTQGLGDVLIRTGPLFEISSWFVLGFNGTLSINRDIHNLARQEMRFEVEPSFNFRYGNLNFNDRNRLEYRLSPNQNTLWYRNQLKINYTQKDLKFIPFISNEVFLELGSNQIKQNRASLGIGFNINDNTKIDLGYILRNRYTEQSKWENDHILSLSILSDFWSK